MAIIQHHNGDAIGDIVPIAHSLGREG